MPESQRKLAVVTGASTGIGFELARECAQNEFDLLIAANESELESAADQLRREGGTVDTVQADLATTEGVDQLYEKLGGRPVLSPSWNAAARSCPSRLLSANPSNIPIRPVGSRCCPRAASDHAAVPPMRAMNS